jgi:hypothetical protein
MKHLIIGGAPKAGTGALFDLFRQHPNVLRANKKETFFFIDLDNPLINPSFNCHTKSVDDYKKEYFKSTKEFKYYLEGTTHLMYQKDVFAKLRELGDIQLILILREPVERIKSSFLYTKNNLGRVNTQFTLDDYVKALLDNNLDLISEMIEDTKSRYVLTNEITNSRYINHLTHLENDGITPTVITYDELRRNPYDCLKSISLKLNLDLHSHNYENKKRNVTTSVGNLGIHQKIKKLRSIFLPNVKIGWLKKMYYRLQADKDDKTTEQLSFHLEKELKALFEQSNQQLAAKYHLNLNNWK